MTHGLQRSNVLRRSHRAQKPLALKQNPQVLLPKLLRLELLNPVIDPRASFHHWHTGILPAMGSAVLMCIRLLDHLSPLRRSR
jgi:hypothetical protein